VGYFFVGLRKLYPFFLPVRVVKGGKSNPTGFGLLAKHAESQRD